MTTKRLRFIGGQIHLQKSFEVEIWNVNVLKRFALKMKWSKYSRLRIEGSFLF